MAKDRRLKRFETHRRQIGVPVDFIVGVPGRLEPILFFEGNGRFGTGHGQLIVVRRP
jgi:hypothetical protein